MSLTTKTYAQMADEVEEVNRANGWYDTDRTLAEDIALLHSEVSEALEAYRDHRLEDATAYSVQEPVTGTLHLPKPEGVGSEFADVLIRLLDTAKRYSAVDLDAVRSHGLPLPPAVTFGATCADLHGLISKTYEWQPTGHLFNHALGRLLATLNAACDQYGIDLLAEYERKIAYNRTRSYRHGGRTL